MNTHSATQNSIEKPDYLRDLLAWIIFAVSVTILLLIKPPVVLRESTMFLSQVTNLTPIDKEQVKIINDEHFNSYVAYNKVGFITITMPYLFENRNELSYHAIDHARKIAAQSGADKLLVEHMVTSPWFDTGKTVFRIQAIALK